MITEHPKETYLKAMVEQCKGSGKTFAEFLASSLEDTLIEIYLGDSYEEVSTEQISSSYPAVFCGKIVSAYRECLMINALYVDRTKQIKQGHIMFINERAIRALNIIDGDGILEDMFMRSKESLKILKHFRK
jgi:hypothetical protein